MAPLTPLKGSTNFLRRSPRIKKAVSILRSPPKASTIPVKSLLLPGATGIALAADATGSAEGYVEKEPRSLEPESGAVRIADNEEVAFMTKVYTFLCRLNKNDLRKTCKTWRQLLSGNKPELLFRAFFYLKKIEEAGKNVTEIVDLNTGCPRFREVLETAELECIDWKVPPSVESMTKHLLDAGDKLGEDGGTFARNHISSKGDDASQDPNFTHSEFARLVLIMRDDDVAKASLLGLSQSLQRAAQDAGKKRDDIWATIADRFNDKTLVLNFSFDGEIDGVDISQGPLCQRTGAFLKDQFHKTRPEFPKALCKWRASGQNDPERFKNFLSYHHGQMYSVCKRALILFVCSGLGTPHVHTLLVDSATKSIVDGGYEEGIAGENGNVEKENRAEKRRKISGSAIFENVQDVSETIKEVSSLMKSLANAEGCGVGNSVTVGTRMDPAQEEDNRFKRVKDTFLELQWAQQNSSSVPKIIEYAKIRHEQAMKAYEQLLEQTNVTQGPRAT